MSDHCQRKAEGGNSALHSEAKCSRLTLGFCRRGHDRPEASSFLPTITTATPRYQSVAAVNLSHAVVQRPPKWACMHQPGDGYCFLCIAEEHDRQWAHSKAGQKDGKAECLRFDTVQAAGRQKCARKRKIRVSHTVNVTESGSRTNPLMAEAKPKSQILQSTTTEEDEMLKPLHEKVKTGIFGAPAHELRSEDMADVVKGDRPMLLGVHMGSSDEAMNILVGLTNSFDEDSLELAHLDASKDEVIMEMMKMQKLTVQILLIPGQGKAMIRYDGELTTEGVLEFLKTQEAIELKLKMVMPVKEKPIEEKPIEEKPIEEKPIEEKPIEEKDEHEILTSNIRQKWLDLEAKMRIECEDQQPKLVVERPDRTAFVAQLATEASMREAEVPQLGTKLKALEDVKDKDEETASKPKQENTNGMIDGVSFNVLSQVACVFPKAGRDVLLGIAKLLALFLETDIDGSGDISGDELAAVMHAKEMQKWRNLRELRIEIINTGTLMALQNDDNQNNEKAGQVVDDDDNDESGAPKLLFKKMKLNQKIASMQKALEDRHKEELKAVAQKVIDEPDCSVEQPKSLEEHERMLESVMMEWDLDNNGELDFYEFSMMVSAGGVALDEWITALPSDVKNSMMALVGEAEVIGGCLCNKSNSRSPAPSPNKSPLAARKAARKAGSMFKVHL